MERVQHITSHTVLPETKNMFHRFQGHAILTGLVLLAMPLCLPDVTRADDEADLRAAFGEGQTLDQKGDYPGAARPIRGRWNYHRKFLARKIKILPQS